MRWPILPAQSRAAVSPALLRALGALGALVATVAVAHPLAAQRGDQEREAPVVKAVNLRGVHAVDAAELRNSIATTASRCRSILLQPFCWFSHSPYFYQREYFDHTEFQRDVLRIRVFYYRRGYRDTQVDTSVVRSGKEQVTVNFRITEGPPTLVSVLRVNHDTVATDRDIARRMLVRAGDPLDLIRLDSSATLLRQLLEDRGHADAQVTQDSIAVDTATRRARVVLTMHPRWKTYVGAIEITGNEQVSEQTIRRSLTMQPGDVYRLGDVLTSQRNLYESNLFRHAVIVVPPRGDSIKTIEVTVREAPPRAARLSGGFNTAEFVQFQGRFTHYNFTGGARRLELQAAIGNLFASALNNVGIFSQIATQTDFGGNAAFQRPTWQLNASLTQPWFRSPRNTLALGLFAHRQQAIPVYIDHGYGASATFTRDVAERAPLSLTYRYERTKVEATDVFFCVNYGVCDTQTIAALHPTQSLSPIALTGSANRSNDPFFPTAGYNAQASVEYASQLTLSDWHYVRAYVEGALYHALGRHLVLATHAELGWVRPLGGTMSRAGSFGVVDLLHPRKRFYTGGSQSVRGFGENQLGPRVLTVAASKLASIGCDTSSVAGIASCDPRGSHQLHDSTGALVFDKNGQPVMVSLAPRDFTPRPVGGTTLLEGNVELRFPIWRELGGAVFLDGAVVGESTLPRLSSSTSALTPGFGFRYLSPVGPVRVDVGIAPPLTERLTVVSEAGPKSDRRIVPLAHQYDYPNVAGHGIFGRMLLHLSIGQAF